MKTIGFFCVCAVALISATSVMAADWEVVYQTDFSSDPDWTTNSPSNMNWDPVSQRYHLQSTNGSGQYAYKLLPITTISTCKLEYDIETIHLDWASGPIFGLGDSDMDISQPSTFWGCYANGDRGNGAILEYHSQNSQGRLGDNYAFLFDLNTVYHNIITYDSPTQTLIWQAFCNGTVVFEEQRTGVGSFVDMDRLYSSQIGHDYAPGAMGEAYIDNVVFSVPEPATLLLLGLGGLLLKKSK
jgi:hypothetical protein